MPVNISAPAIHVAFIRGLPSYDMAEKIVSMHAAHRSDKEVIDGFLVRFGTVQSVRRRVIYYQNSFPDPEDLRSISAPISCHFGTNDAAAMKTEIDTLERHRKKYEIAITRAFATLFSTIRKVKTRPIAKPRD